MMKIVGKEIVDYFSKKSNKQVTGITLHVVYEGDPEKTEGLLTDDFFISTKSNMYDSCVELPVGSEVNVYYNRWGNVETVVPCKKN